MWAEKAARWPRPVAGLAAALGTPIAAVGAAPVSSPAATAARGIATASADRATTTATAAGGARALKMIWGPGVLPTGRSAFPTYHELGVNVYEIQLLWDDVALAKPKHPRNPRDRAYRWPASVDQAVRDARRYGIRVCLLVQRTPAWANGGRANTWAPNNAADFGHFLVAASRRYPSVRYWMIWGETNRNPDFYPMPPSSPVGPRRYALVLNAAYHALKSVRRSNIVIGGDTMTYGNVHPPDFIRWMRLPNGKPPPLDYYGHNPYSDRFPRLRGRPYAPGERDLSDVDTLESQLRRTYHRTVKLWLSEYSISSDHTNRAFAYAVSRRRQADWLTAAFRLVDSIDYVAGLGWYDLIDESSSVPRHLTTGLMTSALKPKPAFYAFQHAP
jgi:hypothetical protein